MKRLSFLTMLSTLLLMAANSAWAQKYNVKTFNSEYTAVKTVYAGCQNYFKLEVENTSGTAGSNVKVNLYADDVIVTSPLEIADFPAGETETLEIVDPTIRPVTENTVLGNNNENVVYKIEIEENGVVSGQGEYSFVILYNGNLGKDHAYPYTEPFMRIETFTGNVLVYNCAVDSKASDTEREDVIPVELDGGSVHRALLYVSYNWDKAPEGDFKSWTTTFNEQTITPIANYRDQTNLGTYGAYGYGLVVYDVTSKVVDGDNTFALQKTAGNSAVYPSSLIVMVKNPSADPQVVYIAEEADILSKQYNQHKDAIYHSSFEDVVKGDATLCVFAAGAQAGEGNIIINDKTTENIWDGTSTSFDMYATPVDAGDVDVQLQGTGSTILALQQMLVVTVNNPGDANGDNVVNVADIVEMQNYISGNPSDNFKKKNADISGDGEVDETDITQVLSIIMSCEDTSAPAVSKSLKTVTTNEVGWRIGSDGKAYSAGRLPIGVTAVAVICYVGDAGSVDASSTTYRGLAIALTDASNSAGMQYSESLGAYCSTHVTTAASAVTVKNGIACTNGLTSDGHTHAAASACRSYTPAAPKTYTSDWFLASMGQWQLICQGLATKKAGSPVTTQLTNSANSAYQIDNLSSIITDAGGTSLWATYWSCTEYENEEAPGRAVWNMYFNGGATFKDGIKTDTNRKVRPVLAF